MELTGIDFSLRTLNLIKHEKFHIQYKRKQLRS